MAVYKDFEIEQGKTFTRVVRWETKPVVYKQIAGISNTAPAQITVPSHNIPDGWRVAVVSVKGMTQINAGSTPPSEADYHECTVVDINTITINDINAADFKTYVSGGYVQFNTPVSLVGFTARMTIKSRIGGTELLKLSTELGDSVVIDQAARKITLNISADTTAAFTWVKGVYELEMVSPIGVVTSLLRGDVSIIKEAAT